MTRSRTLEDFPLHDGALERSSDSPVESRRSETARGAAPLSSRLPAAAADAAAVLLLTALGVLGARLWTGMSPGPRGLLWVAAFAVYLWAFATVVPIVAFGRTVGMALADLTARSAGGGSVTAAAAFRRWLGTLATAATGGLLLLWTARDAQAPTPADRISGCALIGD